MSKSERVFMVVVLLFISIAAIDWIGQQYHALLAVLEMLLGVLIGMVIFLPNRKGT